MEQGSPTTTSPPPVFHPAARSAARFFCGLTFRSRNEIKQFSRRSFRRVRDRLGPILQRIIASEFFTFASREVTTGQQIGE